MNTCDDHAWAGEGECPKCEKAAPDMTDGQWDEITRGRTAPLSPIFVPPGTIDNILRPTFRTSAVNELMNDFRAVIRKEAYDKLTFCELIGVIELVKLEQYERNKG